MAAEANPFSCPKLAFRGVVSWIHGSVFILLSVWIVWKQEISIYVLLPSVRAFCRFIILFCPNTKQAHVKRGTMSEYEMKEVRAAEHAGYDISFAGNRTWFLPETTSFYPICCLHWGLKMEKFDYVWSLPVLNQSLFSIPCFHCFTLSCAPL